MGEMLEATWEEYATLLANCSNEQVSLALQKHSNTGNHSLACWRLVQTLNRLENSPRCQGQRHHWSRYQVHTFWLIFQVKN
jgi:hypothetical protein